jgi:hypothetical protein
MNWSAPGIAWANCPFVKQRMSERMKSLLHSEKNWLHIRRTHGVKILGNYQGIMLTIGIIITIQLNYILIAGIFR